MITLDQYLKRNNITLVHGYIQGPKVELLKRLIKETNSKKVLEIGFNGGHSADAILSIDKNITLTSIDIGTFSNVCKVKVYIDSKFPHQHTLIIGDSKQAVPKYKKDHPSETFDLIFIDGGHDYNIAKADIINSLTLSNKNTLIVMDDIILQGKQLHYTEGPTKAWKEALIEGLVKEDGHLSVNGCGGVSWGYPV